MVVVDKLTKYGHFILFKHPYIAIMVAKAFTDHVIKLHGMSASIVSDHDKGLTSLLSKTLFQL